LHPLHLFHTTGVYFNRRQWALLLLQTRFQICCSYSFQQENRSGQARKGHCHILGCIMHMAYLYTPNKTEQIRMTTWFILKKMAKDEHDMYTATWTPKLNPNGKQCYIWVHTNLLVSDETWTPPMLWWTEAELYNHTVFLANSHKKTESVWHWSWSSLCFWWMMRRIRTIEVTWCNNLI